METFNSGSSLNDLEVDKILDKFSTGYGFPRPRMQQNCLVCFHVVLEILWYSGNSYRCKNHDLWNFSLPRAKRT